MITLFDESEPVTVPQELVNLDVEFTSFIEALVDHDEDLAALDCDDFPIATRIEQHKPSPPSKDSYNHVQTVQSFPEGPPAADDPKATASNSVHVSAELTKETNLEKVRAKNRRNQKAFRKRQKQLMQELRESLRAQVDSVTQTLEETRHRWRHLRLHRSSLLQRLKALPALQHSQSNPDVSETPEAQQSTSYPPISTIKAHQIAVENVQSRYSQLVPTSAARSPPTANFSPFSRQQAGNYPDSQHREKPRPISSFSSCEPLSFAAISPFLGPSKIPMHALKYNALSHAISVYQQSVAAHTGVPVADICWFQQWRFPGLEQNLSFTASGGSPACNLTVSTCLMLAHFESMLLVAEHEMLLEACDRTYKPPEHPTFAAASTPVATPTPPDPTLLRRFYIRCGVNQTMPLKVGLDRTLQALLAKYCARLPRARWGAVCMQMIRVLQSLTEALAVATGASEGSPGVDAVSQDMRDDTDPGESDAGAKALSAESLISPTANDSDQDMTWEDLGVAVRVAYQHMACCTHESLHDANYTKSATDESSGGSVAQVEERMFEIVCTTNLSYTTYFEVAPVTARRTVLTQFIAASQNSIMVRFRDPSFGPPAASRQNMVLYKQLQLQPDQRAFMAERWRSWCRRRAALGHQLTAALARFQDVCPQQTDIPSALVRCATLVATDAEGKAPVDTGAQHTPVHSGNDAESSFITLGTAGANTEGSDTHEESSVPLWTRAFSQLNVDGEYMNSPAVATICDRKLVNSTADLSISESFETEDSADFADPSSSEVRVLPDFTSPATSDGVNTSHAMPAAITEIDNAWAPCMVCGEGRRALLLGERWEVAKAASDALGSVLDVHTSDALMHFEFIGPFWELTEKQQAIMLASAIDLGQPTSDTTALWQAAAEEERRDALFGHLTSFYI